MWELSLGSLAAFVLVMQATYRPMKDLAKGWTHLMEAAPSAERFFELMDEAPDVVDVPGALRLEGVREGIRISEVSFSYGREPVLRDVSLDVSAGEVVAIVGLTGAGKTTIITLLSRFYDVDQGAIAIDGHDIRSVRQKSIRRQLGIVLQDTFLFSGTVMDNIRYGRLDATDDEVVAAAKLANADWFIRRLPEGYRSAVSEKGHNFSQGQRQLLAIARAVLADPRILILDEATSSVDTRTEMNIQDALLRLMAGRTAFVIAHRLSTIRQADQVLVIDDGRLIEQGDHYSLLEQKGFYYNLYMSQFLHVQEPTSRG